ncbi:hypothetical protein OLK001_30520 [Synechocystis sp. LKSZ1]
MLTLMAEWSRLHCVGLCAVLVPTILLLTLQSLLLVYFQHRDWRFQASASGAFVAIVLLIGHVATWFSIGVITPVTFILLTLSLTCLAINTGLWAWVMYQGRRSSLAL